MHNYNYYTVILDCAFPDKKLQNVFAKTVPKTTFGSGFNHIF